MNRRDASLALSALAALPLSIEAQQQTRRFRIGYLLSDPRRSVEPWTQALSKLGWNEGQNIVVESRFSEGKAERLPALAAELVRLNVDVIVAEAAPHTEAAKNATKTIPIVFVVHGDPVGSGHVASLSRPGGNITGTSQMLPELCGKRLQLFRELVPTASRVAVLWNAANPIKLHDWKATQDAAKSMGLTLESFEVRRTEDFNSAFAAIRLARPDGLMTLEDALVIYHRSAIVDFAARDRFPAIYGIPGYVDIGGLMSYGVTFNEFARMTALYVDKILRGVKPAELPVQQPTIFHLEINQKTARALNLIFPQSMLIRADQVID